MQEIKSTDIIKFPIHIIKYKIYNKNGEVLERNYYFGDSESIKFWILFSNECFTSYTCVLDKYFNYKIETASKNSI